MKVVVVVDNTCNGRQRRVGTLYCEYWVLSSISQTGRVPKLAKVGNHGSQG
jgi:hypothetical protein